MCLTLLCVSNACISCFLFNSCPAVDTSDTAWRQAILGLSKGRLGLRSLYQLAPAAYIASICSAGFGSETNLHLCSAVADFNSAVPLTRHCKFTPFSQRLWSPKKNYPAHWIDTCMFNLLLETSSNADQAQLLSVSAPHASSWLSVLPSQGLGLHLDAPVYEVAIKWWLGMDTSQGSQCALCPGNALNLWDISHHL